MPDPINPIGALPTYREALTAPALLAGVDTSAWAPVRPTPNWLGAGLRAGGNELLGLGGAAVEALGRATGADSVARWGNAVAADRMQAAQEAGRPDLERAPWEPGGGSPLPWLGYQVAKQVPALGAMILGGALVPEAAVPAALTRLGAVAPRVLGGGAGLEAGAAAKAGQEFAQHVTGATIAGYPIGVGALTEAAKEGGELTPEKARAALVGGAPWAAVGGLVPTQLRNLATQGTAGSLARRILTGAATTGATAGPQMAVQTALAQGFGPPKSLEERSHEIVNAALTGSLTGAALGGVLGVRAMKTVRPEQVDNQTLTDVVDNEIGAPQPTPEPAQEPRLALPAPEAREALPPASMTPEPPVGPITEGSPRQPVPEPDQGAESLARAAYQRLLTDQEPSEALTKVARYFGLMDDQGRPITPEALVAERNALQDQVEQARRSYDPEGMQLAQQRLRDISAKAAFLDRIMAEPGAAQERQLFTAGELAQPAEGPVSRSLREERERSQAQVQGVRDLAAQIVGRPTQFTRSLNLRSEDELKQHVFDQLAAGKGSRSLDALGRHFGFLTEDGRMIEPDVGTTAPQEPARAADVGTIAPQGVFDLTFATPRAEETPQATQRWVKDVVGDKARMAPAPTRAELTARVVDQMAAGRPSGAAKTIAAHLGLTDENGRSVPLADALARAQDDLAQGKQRLQAEPSEEATQAVRGAQDRVDLLQATQEHITAREAEAAARQARVDALAKVPDRAKDQWRALETLRESPDVADAIKRRAEAAQGKLETDATGAKQTAARVLKDYADAQRVRTFTTVDPQVAAENSGALARRQTEGDVVAAERANEALGQNIEPSPEVQQFAREQKLTTETPEQRRARLAAEEQAAVDRINQRAAQARRGPGFQPSSAEVFAAERNLRARTEQPHLGEPKSPKQLDADIKHLVDNGAHGGHVLDYLKQVGDADTQRFVEALQRAGVKSKLQFASPEGVLTEQTPKAGEKLLGSYNASQDRINLYDVGGLRQTILHELTHAATQRAIDAQTPAARELQALFDRVKEREGASDAYGLTNAKEFIAEAFSNPRFAAFLRNQDVSTGSRLGDMWQTLKNAVFRLLRMPERARALFDQVMDAGQAVMRENASVVEGADVETPRIGSIEDANRVAKDFAATAGALKDHLVARGFGPKSIKDGAFAASLGFTTDRGMADHHGALFKSGALHERLTTNTFRDVVGSRITQLGYLAQKARDGLEKPIAKDLNRVMYLATQLGIDPLKRFADQPHLHKMENAGELRKLTDEMNRTMDRVRQKGGMDAYNKTVAFNEMAMLSRLANLMRTLKSTEYGDASVIGYVSDPFEAFVVNERATEGVDLHTSPQAARDFWRDVVMQELQGAQQHVNEQQATVAGLPKKDATRQKVEAAVQPLSDAVEHVESVLNTMQEAPYFHIGRDGDHFVAMKLIDAADPTRLTPRVATRLQQELTAAGFSDLVINQHVDNSQVFMRVDNRDQAERLLEIAKKLEKEGIAGDVLSGLIDEKFNKVVPGWMERLVAGVGHDTNFDDETRAVVQRELRRIQLDMMPARRLVWQPRQNVQGFSGDMFGSQGRYARITANALAHLSVAQKLNDVFGKLNADVQEAKRQGDLGKTTQMQLIQRELNLREASKMWRPVHDIGDLLRSGANAWYLALSPAYVLQNLSQMGMVALPEMAKTHGFTSSAAALTRTLPTTIKIMRAITGGELRGQGIATADALRRAGVPPETARFILDAINRGRIGTTFTRDAVGSRLGAKPTLEKWLHWSNLSTLYTETAMQVNVALAARDLYHQRAAADMSLHEFVDKNLIQGLQDYSPANTMRQLGKQGVLGKYTPVAAQFARWQLNMIEKLYSELHDLLGQGSSAEQRLEAAKFLGGHFAMVTAFAGTMGLPGLQTALGLGTNIANTLGGTDRFDFDQNYRAFLSAMLGKEFGDAVARGLPHLVGVDLKKIGDQDLIPFSEFLTDQRKFEDAAPDLAWRSLGASVSMVANIGRSLRDIAHGDVQNGMKALLPTALRHPYEAYLLSRYGYEDRKGARWPVQPSNTDIALQALGIEPASKAQLIDAQRELRAIQDRREERRGYLVGNAQRAESHHDAEGLRSAFTELMAYSRENPGQRVNFGQMLALQRQKEAQARALHAPLGVSPYDVRARGMLAPYYLPN
jgi:hypothetical protein